MHPALAVGAYFAFIFLGGALLAPWLFKLAALGSSISPLLQSLAEQPFHRYVDRSLLLLGMIGLWPFLRASGMRFRTDVGLRRQMRYRGLSLGLGFSMGFGSMLLVAELTLISGARLLD